MTLFVRVEEFISLQHFMFVSTSVVELLDSTTICMSINIGQDCLLLFFMKYIVYIFLNMTRFVGVTGLYLSAKVHVF